MALYREVTADAFERWSHLQPIDGIRYQENIEQIWADDELAAVGLYRPVEPPIPIGQRVVSTTVGRVLGVVSYVYELETEPGAVDAQFPPLQPWQFWSIIDLSGIGEQALYDAIDLIPDDAFKTKARRKLANPPGGVFKRSDPLFSNSFLMMQLSLTKEAIDALWTQGLALE